MHAGEPAPQPYFWHFCAGADHDDEPYGLGLAHWLYWPTLFKRNGIKFWLIFLEKFGMPTGVGKYDSDASADERARLLRATKAMQTDSGIIMPKGMELELLEAARSGTADYKILCDSMDAAIQKVTLGQTASTQGSPGKLGNDDLAGDVREDIVTADADLVCESFNQGPSRWLTQWNFPGAEVPRVYRVTEKPEDLSKRAERDEKVARLGFKPKLVYIQQTYGGEWHENTSPKPPDPNAPPPGDASFAEPGTGPSDPPQRMTGQLAKRATPAVTQWIDRIRELGEKAESLEALRDELLKLLPDMSLDDYAAALQEAFAAAALAGRYEVLQEAGR